MTAIKSHFKEVKAWAVVTKRGALGFAGVHRSASAAWAMPGERVIPCVVRYLVPVKAGKLK